MTQQIAEEIAPTLLRERVPLLDGGEFSRRDGDEDTCSIHARLVELEAEHLRLQRLVAELLIKNQKLREMLCEQAGSSAAAANFCGHGASIERMHISAR
ncbi:MAG: hypothetical protein ACLQMO_08385 [Acidobacteriaceae bacterium]